MKQANPPSPFEMIMEYIDPLLPITDLSARRLSEYFNTSPEFWINIQKNYDESNVLKKEHFIILIDGKMFIRKERFIRGKKIKRLAGISKEREKFSNNLGNVTPCWRAFLRVNGMDDDKYIGDNEWVDLLQPGRKKFYTASVCTLPV